MTMLDGDRLLVMVAGTELTNRLKETEWRRELEHSELAQQQREARRRCTAALKKSSEVSIRVNPVKRVAGRRNVDWEDPVLPTSSTYLTGSSGGIASQKVESKGIDASKASRNARGHATPGSGRAARRSVRWADLVEVSPSTKADETQHDETGSLLFEPEEGNPKAETGTEAIPTIAVSAASPGPSRPLSVASSSSSKTRTTAVHPPLGLAGRLAVDTLRNIASTQSSSHTPLKRTISWIKSFSRGKATPSKTNTPASTPPTPVTPLKRIKSRTTFFSRATTSNDEIQEAIPPNVDGFWANCARLFSRSTTHAVNTPASTPKCTRPPTPTPSSPKGNPKPLSAKAQGKQPVRNSATSKPIPIPSRPRRGDGSTPSFDPMVHADIQCGLRKEEHKLAWVIPKDIDDGMSREEYEERYDEHEWSTF